MSAALDQEVRSLLQEGLARFGRESYTFDKRSAALTGIDAYCTDAWANYAELGWLALRLPEELGGLDADAALTGALMETVGRNLLLEPLLASAVLGTGALLRANSAVLAELAPALADGSLKLAFAHEGESTRFYDGRLSGRKVGVLHGDVADQFIVSAGSGPQRVLAWVDGRADGFARKSYRLVDGRGAAIVTFDDTPAQLIGDATAVDQLLDEAAVALCAESLGSASRLVEATAVYLKVRKQFGRAIGTNQALQHRMSEMYILQQEIHALTTRAQQALDRDTFDRNRIVSGARAYTIAAAREIGNAAVQLHGGVGVTEELEISHHFRRLMVNAALFGGRDAQIERFAAAGAHA
jgi:alkylation response protein AidB-like acyl-CoA dehydrogenase